MIVFFVTTSISYGGASKILCFVAEKMAALGHNVVIYNMRETMTNERQLNEGIEIIHCKSSRTGIRRKLDQVIEISKELSARKPDIIVSFKFSPNYIATFLGKVHRIPVVISERSDPSKEIKLDTIRDRIYWMIINSADGAVFQTVGAKKYYSSKLQKKSIVIGNPIKQVENVISEDEIRFKQEKAIISVGRLVNSQKRYDVMIKGFEIFHKEHPDYHLRIFGSGADEQMIKKLIADQNLDNSVHLLGVTGNPQEEMRKCQVFIITSDYEGIPNSLLEAMAIGMPVVATDCSPGGARMLVSNRINGILLGCGDSMGIADALNELVNNEEIRVSFSKKASEVAIKFSPDKIGKDWADYLQFIQREYK